MIGRYTREEMGRLWTDEAKFGTWLEVELLASERQAQLGVIPKTAPARMRKRAKFTVAGIEKIERTTNHDVIAFVTDVGRSLGKDETWLHYGLTSSDVVDTALSAILLRAGKQLAAGFKPLLAQTRKLAQKHIKTVIAGRTHGVFAEPTSLGLKFALWYRGLWRARNRLRRATEEVAIGKLSGSVGNYANIDPSVEKYVCRRLGLKPAPVSTQIVQRDRHAEFLNAIALCGAAMELIALEVRLLHRTEVGEIEEGFAKGQRGSSSMPHKKNPISCERICGMARVLRGYALTGMENVALWHERDISHSSAERVILADATIALDYMLNLMTRIVTNVKINPARMKENLERAGLTVYSQQLLNALIARLGSRDDAYPIIQRLAHQRGKRTLLQMALEDDEVGRNLSAEEITACFDDAPYLKHARTVVTRALSVR